MCPSEPVIVHHRSISERLVGPRVNATAKSGISEKVDALGGTEDKEKLTASAVVEEKTTDKSCALRRSDPAGVFPPECVDNSEGDLMNNVLLAVEESWDGDGDNMIGPRGNDPGTQGMMSDRSWCLHEQSLPLAEDWLLFARNLSSDCDGASDGSNS